MAGRAGAAWVLAGALATGCGPEAPPEFAVLDLSVVSGNGTSLNGTSYNDSELKDAPPMYEKDEGDGTYSEEEFPTYPDKDSPGDESAGVNPNGTTYGGSPVLGVYSEGLDPSSLVGARVRARLTNGQEALLNVSGASWGTGAHEDILYFVVYVEDGLSWTPLCGTGANGEPVAAIAVPGQWSHEQDVPGGGGWSYDAGRFTFACRGSSITKCVEAGYRPWVDPASSGGTPVARGVEHIDEPGHLQACVRMLRADYCGDGRSWTRNGRMVELWDSMELNTRNNHTWPFEAAWGPDGAECFSSTRILNLNLPVLPPCVLERLDPLLCEEHDMAQAYQDGKLLMSAFEELGVSILGTNLF